MALLSLTERKEEEAWSPAGERSVWGGMSDSHHHPET